MPTGYTSAIANGIDFKTFVMRCARAMGACVSMREYSLEKPIPDEFAPSDYNYKELLKATEELERLSKMSLAEAEMFATSEFEVEFARQKKYRDEQKDLKLKYEAMLRQVELWQSPGPDHDGLKEFMIQQITDSIKFDCDESYLMPVTKLNAVDWLANKITGVKRDIAYHDNKHKEEIERVANQNKWLKDLRESLKEG